jgi:sulfur transfer complex TusBCD TusB component (DsrH family)
MYVKRDIEARYCNHFCSGKVISIKYLECFLDLGTQYCHVWSVRLYNFFRVIS